YSEVSRPRRLVYSWQWEQEDGAPGHVSTVTVDFHTDGERTNVVLEHSGLESSPSRDSHAHGWTGILEMLQVHLFENAAQTS
ncbi:MAG TPA: SRPBCC domain-containing protein, partial [Solirubrobacteraceae bacterium]